MYDLRDLDVQSRAAVSLVDAWQGKHQAVRAIWKLEDLVKLLLRAIDGARDLRRHTQRFDGKPDAEAFRQNAAYFLETVTRIGDATTNVTRVIDMFESEGYSVDRSKELRDGGSELAEMVTEVEALCESLEWEVLEKTALPSATIRAVAAHLASTGQASA